MKNLTKPAYGESIRGNYPVKEFQGIDNLRDPKELAEVSEAMTRTFLSAAFNVDITRNLKLRRRRGWSMKKSGSFHSLQTEGGINFCVKDNQFGVLDGSLGFTALAPASDFQFSCVDTGAGVYCSDNRHMYRYLEGSLVELARAGTYDFNQTSLEDDEQFYDSPPPGKILTWMFGRLWVVTDDYICYSRSYRPDQVNIFNDIIELPGVTMLRPATNGYYIGTEDVVYYISGGNPKVPSLTTTVSSSGCIFGTAKTLPYKLFGDGSKTGECVVWESKHGKMLGSPDGAVTALTIDHVVYNNAQSGASFLRELNGDIHHISTLSNQDPSGQNFRATDIATAEIRRNGIII